MLIRSTGALQAAALAGAIALTGLAWVQPAFAQPTPAFSPGQNVVSYKAAYFAPLKVKTAREMVGRLPGFAYEDSAPGVHATQATGNVVINGKSPALDGKTLSGVLESVPANTVIRIDLVRNGANGVQMAPWSVMANVIVRRPDAIRGSVNTRTEVNPAGIPGETAALNLNRRLGQTSLDFTTEGARTPGGGSVTTGQRIRLSDGSIQLHNRQYATGENDRVVVRSGLDAPFAGGRIRVDGGLSRSENIGTTLTLNYKTGTTSVSRGARNSGRDRNGQVRYSTDLGPLLQFESQLSNADNLSKSKSTSSSGTTTISIRNSGTRTGRISARYRSGQPLSFDAGLETTMNWQGGQTFRQTNGVPDGLPSSSVDADRTRTQIFETTTWRASPKLTLRGGLRFDATTVMVKGPKAASDTFDMLRPSFETALKVSPLTDLNVTVDRGVQPVDIGNFISSVSYRDVGNDDIVTIGNTDLAPQTDWTVRLGVQHRFDGRGLISVSAAHTALSDVVDRILLITQTTDPSTGQVKSRSFEATGNIGGGYRRNLNVNLNLPLDTYGLQGGQVRMQATWRDSKMTDAFTGEDRRFSGEAPMSWTLGLSEEFKDGALRTGLDASGGLDTDSYHRGDVSVLSSGAYLSAYAEYRLTPQVTIRLDARDLTGRIQVTQRDVYAGGDRTGGVISSHETFQTQGGPSFELNVRRNF